MVKVTAPAILSLLIWGTFLVPIFPLSRPAEGSFRGREENPPGHRLTEFQIKARVPVLGDISHVGIFVIEEETRADGYRLEKIFRIFGNSKPEMARKGKDYRGELKWMTCLSLNPEGDAGPAGAGEAAVAASSAGFFNKNGQVQAEMIVFSPDCAVCRRENGDEKRVAGNHGCLATALEYFSAHDFAAGEVREFPFIFGGHSYVFRCEVGKAARLEPYGNRVYPIDFTTYDGILKDGRGTPLVKKEKGDIRIWVSKEGPFKDRIVRLKVKYAWYLTIHMDLYRAS